MYRNTFSGFVLALDFEFLTFCFDLAFCLGGLVPPDFGASDSVEALALAAIVRGSVLV